MLGLTDREHQNSKQTVSMRFLLQVFFPQRGTKGELISGTEWELLNLDTSSILTMPEEVQKLAGLENSSDFMELLSDHLYESVGAAEFARRHPLIEKTCVIVSSTAHISFTKAVTILGLGKNSLVPVAVDENSRMDAGGKQFHFRKKGRNRERKKNKRSKEKRIEREC